ncbi:hypothetical protein KIN20_022476 [Parelaphostrongylus tenuis]|uniref:Uncharacterized protein n=1 Tax=Parelaphostrongylus tenuis TaxID=148309 RepID=A0AAD5MU93_PARTN|nr:hypothetical protein KIN20_022476 [Parelaphostrongylus tenuis]
MGNTVTALCDGMKSGNKLECDIGINKGIRDIANYTSFSGTLTTTNIIMANWSKDMYQNVVNRALRMLASGPSGLQFVAAFATVF